MLKELIEIVKYFTFENLYGCSSEPDYDYNYEEGLPMEIWVEEEKEKRVN